MFLKNSTDIGKLNSYQEFDQETKVIAEWKEHPTILFLMPPNYTVKK